MGDSDPVIVEVKAVTQLAMVHRAQVISYLKALRCPLGLLLNFKESTMRGGVKRVVWSQGDERARKMDKPHEASDRLVVSGRDSAEALEIVEEYFDSIA